ncbi:hypothetical protein KFE94_16890 [bacterium SCSIO 12643]|nr:hypothetical protein KFE94_16890 [bacterium SCSIO 12643]
MRNYIILLFLFVTVSIWAQDTNIVNIDSVTLTGTLNSKTTSIVFENVMYDGKPVSGTIKPNIAVSKYHIDISGKTNQLSGVVYIRDYKRALDLSYGGQSIKGEIKQAVASGARKWNVEFLNETIQGAVVYNAAGTKATFDLSSRSYNVSGQIKRKVGAVIYNLTINEKSVKGVIKEGVVGKEYYNLVLDHLSENELVLFFTIESMRVIEEDLESIEDFQNGDDDHL